jgi:membrane carboxypeptidase/penicillin-binding protein
VSQVAPHFVDYVQQQLEQKYGPAEVYGGGLQVYTSLDPAIQTITEQVAREQIAKLKAQNVTNAAVVVADPHDGEIYAMLGSVNFFDKSIDGQVNVADRLRQPGSSIKPINYVTALDARDPDPRHQVGFPDGPGLSPVRSGQLRSPLSRHREPAYCAGEFAEHSGGADSILRHRAGYDCYRAALRVHHL